MRKLLVLLPFMVFSTELLGEERVEVYFNQLESESYTDPYRKIHRPGQNLEKVLIEAISEAKESIFVAVQELRLPNVAKALAQKFLSGVDVRVVLENNYNNTLLTAGDPDGDENNQHEASKFVELFALVDIDKDGVITREEMDERDGVHILQKYKVPVKDDTFDGSMGSGLMHHKFVVIDNKTVIVSTANFTISGTHGDFLNSVTTGNANSMVKIESKDVAWIFNKEFFQLWGGFDGRMIPRFGMGKSYRSPKTARVDNTEITVQFSPTSRLLDWDKSVNGLIGRELKKANHEILMALFVFSDQNLVEILRKRHRAKRSVKFGVLVEPKFAYRSYSETLDMWGLSLLDENCQYEEGNHPWINPVEDVGVPELARGDLLHHKFGVIDAETVIVGSQNWSSNANFHNDENVIVIKNSRIARAFKREYQRLERVSRKGPSHSLLNRISRMERICASR